jgi:hypothetical protein
VPVESSPSLKEWYEKPQTLAILGEPHVSATEFYMEDPGKEYDIFNYDYATKSRNKIALSDSRVKLRGRKFYWHSKIQQRANKEKDNPSQLWTVRPVKANKTFVFDVAFERLTSTELAKLIWTLEIGGRNTHAHKLGHGKPIGYGSVQMRVDMEKSVLWEIDEDLNIVGKPLKEKSEKLSLADPEGIFADEFIKITDFDNCPNNVQYPKATVVDNKGTDTNIFSWFGINKEIMSGFNPTNPRITNVLPKINDEEISLPDYTYTKNGRIYTADEEKTRSNIKGNRK